MVNPGNPIIWRNALFEGIAAFELVRRGKRKWKSTALKSIKKVQKWVDSGNVNCVHILYLLQAEKAAMERNMDEARGLFDKAIVTAARNGFQNDRALASERCAAMCKALGDEFWFQDYYSKAKEAYTAMEAFGKVEQMVDHSTEKGDSGISIQIDIGEPVVAGKPGVEVSDLASLPTRATPSPWIRHQYLQLP